MGIINLNKPSGITSHKAVKKVQRLIGAKKAGHAGTLDPEAEGVLLVCINEATRITEYLTELTKEYVVQIQLGISTDTYDLTGRVLSERDCSGVTEDDIKRVLERFTGQIEQVPPMYSAVKKDGVPLYKLARKGMMVDRPKRKVTIYSMSLLYFSLPEVILRVVCSKGTYIRSLVHEIGEALAVGASVKRLQRIAVGHFRVDEAVGFEELREGRYRVYSIDEALAHMPLLKLNKRQTTLAAHGTGLRIPLPYDTGTLLRLAGPTGQTFAIGKVKGPGELKIEKVLIPL